MLAGISLSEIVDLLGLNASDYTQDQLSQTFQRLAPLPLADADCISFAVSAKYAKQLSQTQAGLLIVPPDVECDVSGIRLPHPHPYLAFAKVSRAFSPDYSEPGIHPSAVVHPTAQLGEGVRIAANVVIEANVELEASVIVGAGTVIAHGVKVGKSTLLHPNVTLCYDVQVGADCIIHSGTVVGSDGFGYAPNGGQWEKIAQLGRVTIGNSVEIGSNVSVDRGALEDTRIEDGAKIDNLVHIAHNCVIGQHTAIAGQTGMAGTTHIGAHCSVGGQVGFAGHLKIADGVVVMGKSMVPKSINEPGVYSSANPCAEASVWRKNAARLGKLDDWVKRIIALEKRDQKQ